MLETKKLNLPYTKVPADAIASLSLSSNGSAVAIKIDGQALTLLWLDGRDPMMRRINKPKKSSETLESFGISQSGDYIATYHTSDGHQNQTEHIIRLRRTSPYRLEHTLYCEMTYPYRESLKDIVGFQFLEDDTQVAAITRRGEVAIWSVKTGKLLRAIGEGENDNYGIYFANHAKWFLTVGRNIDLYEKTTFPYTYGYLGRYYTFYDGIGLIAHHSRVCHKLQRVDRPFFRHLHRPPGIIGVNIPLWNTTFDLLDSYSGATYQSLLMPKPVESILMTYEVYQSDQHNMHYSVSYNNASIAGVAQHHHYIWDVETGHILQEVEHESTLNLVGFSADDKYIIFRDENLIQVWDIAQQQWHDKHKLVGEVYCVALSAQNRLVALVRYHNKFSLEVIDLVF